MKIRTRLALLFTLLTATILLIFAAVIYFSAKDNREKEFYTLLEKEAFTKANLFFDAKVSVEVLQEIYRSNREILNEVEVAIFNSELELLYHDAVDIDFVKETPEMLQTISRESNLKFYQDNWQVLGLIYRFNNQNYIITAAAYDEYGFKKLSSLLKNIMLVFTLSIVLIYLTGLYMSKKAFDPVKEITDKAKIISATNLDLRLNSSDKKDELTELASTFNAMLSRLENSFDAQKHFVSNMAHELRTPLAAIITELELAANKDKSLEEYKAVLQNALTDTRKLVRLSTSLLDLAKASYDASEIKFETLRIDEVLLDARQQLLQSNADYHVDIQFDEQLIQMEDFDLLAIRGNEHLLRIAFLNLMENACKFSDNQTCLVLISVVKKKILISFRDHGLGIAEEDLLHLFTPFYRGKNKNIAHGNGIGLYLTQKIVHLHQGVIDVQSFPGNGTIFKVEFEL